MKITNEDKAKVFFEKLCEWRYRLHHEGCLRHIVVDDRCNQLIRDIEDIEYFIWKVDEDSDDNEEYTYALRKNDTDINICTELDFDYNLKEDRSYY